MSDTHIEGTGIVISSNRGIMQVEMDPGGNIIEARPGGKIRQNKINIVVGDRVAVSLSPYDLTKGFITRRL